MRVVLDTNILVSSVLSAKGLPRHLVNAARAQVFELCSSPVLMAELLDVLSREKFTTRFLQAGLTPLGIVKDLRRMAYMITPTHDRALSPTIRTTIMSWLVPWQAVPI